MITVVSNKSVESDYSLDVQKASASGSPELATEDSNALQKVITTCLHASKNLRVLTESIYFLLSSSSLSTLNW